MRAKSDPAEPGIEISRADGDIEKAVMGVRRSMLSEFADNTHI